MFDPVSIIILLVIGAIAGWIAGNIMKGGGLGMIGNIVVGVIGAFIGSYVMGFLGLGSMISSPIVYSLVSAVIGACILLFILSLVKR